MTKETPIVDPVSGKRLAHKLGEMNEAEVKRMVIDCGISADSLGADNVKMTFGFLEDDEPTEGDYVVSMTITLQKGCG